MNVTANSGKSPDQRRRTGLMKQCIACGLILIATAGTCRKGAVEIPTGTWKYRLLVNGAAIGRAVVTNRIVSNNWVSSMDMEMEAGTIKNTSHQVITETLDFKPVKLELYNKTIQNDQVNEIKTIATFTGNKG